MKLSELITIPLRESYLCNDMQCQVITTDPRRCPVCHSSVSCLVKLLDRLNEEVTV